MEEEGGWGVGGEEKKRKGKEKEKYVINQISKLSAPNPLLLFLFPTSLPPAPPLPSPIADGREECSLCSRGQGEEMLASLAKTEEKNARYAREDKEMNARYAREEE